MVLAAMFFLAARAEAGATSNYYGYSTSQQAYSWIDATDGTEADVSSTLGPIALGFSLDFFENSYTDIYIHEDGTLSFGESSALNALNRSIPHSVARHNLVMAFWDDLDVGELNSGKVFYKQQDADTFIVQWEDVSRFDTPSDLLTFQILLHSDGQICYQYQDLNGNLESASVGIEDADGVDGEQWLYNESGLAALEATNALCFDRPAAGRHVKASHRYQGHFVEAGPVTYVFDVHNIGKLGNDVIDFSAVQSESGWSLAFYNSSGTQLLTDSNSNSKVDTGSVPASGSQTVVAKMVPPAGVSSGDSNISTVTLSSGGDPSATFVIELEAGVSAPFAQSLVLPGTGKFVDRYAPGSGGIATLLDTNFSNNYMAINQVESLGYAFGWLFNGSYFRNIIMATLGEDGLIIQAGKALTFNDNGSSSEFRIRDRDPTLDSLDEDTLGIIWVRDILSGSLQTNSNVHIAIIDPGDEITTVANPASLTENSGWRDNDHESVPIFDHAVIRATADDRFAAAWSADTLQADETIRDVYFGTYSMSGTTVFSPTKITSSAAGDFAYGQPFLASLGNGNVFIAYSRENLDTFNQKVFYQVYSSAGVPVKAQTPIAGADGDQPVALQLGGGDILLVWVDQDNRNVRTALIDGTTYDVIGGLGNLDSPTNPAANNLNIAAGDGGGATVTWLDDDSRDRLYYVWIGSTGDLLLGPIPFGQPQSGTLAVNGLGYGLAPFDPIFRTQLAIVRR
jgi:hypothetical protein